MSGTVLILGENHFSGGIGGQFPDHTISAEEEPTGFEAWRVGVARRSATNYATATTANSAWWLRSVYDRVRAHNCCILDRGHNLPDETFELRTTLDATDFTGTFETCFDVTMPAVVVPNSHIDSPNGVRTEEGAWIKRYPLRTGKATELFIDAMGANLKPQIVGLWAGLAIDLGHMRRGSEDESFQLVSVSMETESGWVGRGRRTRRRRGVLRFYTDTFGQYDERVRYQVASLFAEGTPMWIVPDYQQAERSFLATIAGDAVSFPYSPEDPYRLVELPYLEYCPESR